MKENKVNILKEAVDIVKGSCVIFRYLERTLLGSYFKGSLMQNNVADIVNERRKVISTLEALLPLDNWNL